MTVGEGGSRKAHHMVVLWQRQKCSRIRAHAAQHPAMLVAWLDSCFRILFDESLHYAGISVCVLCGPVMASLSI